VPEVRRSRDILGKAALVVASIALALAIAEGAAQLAVRFLNIPFAPIESEWIDQPTRLTRFDADAGWTLKAEFDNGEVVTNALGFRSRSAPRASAPHRAILAGDSMVFGLGVRQDAIFSELLNRRLPDWDFSNIASMGYNTVQESVLVARHGPVLRPQAIFLFFTEENDQWTNAINSYFYPRVALASNGDLKIGRASSRFEIPWYQTTALKKLLDAKILHGRDLTYIVQRLDFAWRKEKAYTWRVTESAIRKLEADARGMAAKLIVVDIPGRGEWPGTQAREVLLQDLCRTLGVRYYNLRDFYPANPESLFLPADAHWSEAGHAFIADRVEKWLSESESMVPRREPGLAPK
jgi:hypothetical protein